MNYLDHYLEAGKAADPFLHRVGEIIQPLPNNAPVEVKGRAHGGFGAVYFVQSKDTGWMSALKAPRFDLFQNTDTLEAFTREANVWVNLPRRALILPAYRVVRYAGIPYVHMEFVPPITPIGGSAGAILRDKNAALDADAIASLSAQLLYLLADLELWDSSFTHGDIKPDNILLHLPEGSDLASTRSIDIEIRLSDFGLSRYRSDPGTGITTAGDLRYLAPEVLQHFGWMHMHDFEKSEADDMAQTTAKACDIYAIGCTLFEMMSGRQWHLIKPTEKTVATLGEYGVNASAVSEFRPDLGRSAIGVVFECLSRSALHRPKNFSELREMWDAAQVASGRSLSHVTLHGKKVEPKVYPQAEEVAIYSYLTGRGHDSEFALRIVNDLFRASNLRAAGRIEDSDALLQEVEKNVPGFPPVLAARAHGFALRGQKAAKASMGLYAAALDGYIQDEELRSLDKLGFGAACATMAMMIAQMGYKDQADSALALARLAVEYLPNEARSIASMGLALLLQHQADDALKWLRRAHEMDIGNRQLRVCLASCLFVMGVRDSAELENLALAENDIIRAKGLTRILGYGQEE
jgi:serine/threonine protein kinase